MYIPFTIKGPFAIETAGEELREGDALVYSDDGTVKKFKGDGENKGKGEG